MSGLRFPKPRGKRRKSFVPVLPHEALAHIIGDAAPDERKALAQIVETSDIIRLADGREFLLTPATPQLVDRLAAFQAEAADREWDDGDEIEQDDDSANDHAVDCSYINGFWQADDGDMEPDYTHAPVPDEEQRAYP